MNFFIKKLLLSPSEEKGFLLFLLVLITLDKYLLEIFRIKTGIEHD